MKHDAACTCTSQQDGQQNDNTNAALHAFTKGVKTFSPRQLGVWRERPWLLTLCLFMTIRRCWSGMCFSSLTENSCGLGKTFWFVPIGEDVKCAICEAGIFAVMAVTTFCLVRIKQKCTYVSVQERPFAISCRTKCFVPPSPDNCLAHTHCAVRVEVVRSTLLCIFSLSKSWFWPNLTLLPLPLGISRTAKTMGQQLESQFSDEFCGKRQKVLFPDVDEIFAGFKVQSCLDWCT